MTVWLPMMVEKDSRLDSVLAREMGMVVETDLVWDRRYVRNELRSSHCAG